MNTKKLEKFAQLARRQLHQEVGAKLKRVLAAESAARREKEAVVTELEQQIAASGERAVVEQVAYTWFNRFCALRFMDVNRYTRVGIVSPAAGGTLPELLQEAKQGVIDREIERVVDGERVFDLLSGRIPSPDGQQEAYRLLLVAACNAYHDAMPFLFETIDDYTELLLPDDLLSQNAILESLRAALDEEACGDIEVIGWLYQFYISERKDEVIGSKKAIVAADIPAATQLFTPHWIVRYLVENSLGRLWLQNHPESRLRERMDYYVADEQAEKPGFSEKPGFLKVASPEALRVCDPAVGSGHMLTYAFDLLYAIYEEQGYNAVDIPRLILTHNLTGIEIDGRAAALAGFALTMKAREYDRRFLRRGVKPRIVTLQPLMIDPDQLQRAAWFKELSRTLLGHPLRQALLHDLALLQQVDNIGSLLRPQLTLAQIAELRETIGGATDLLDLSVSKQMLAALEMLEPLAQRYHVVVANPPYMGSKNQNAQVKKFLKDEYKDFKADLFSAFIVRIMEMVHQSGQIGMMTPFNWMFLSSFEKLRNKLLKETTLTNLVRPEFHAFFDSAFVTVCGFTLQTTRNPEYKGAFIDLDDFYGANLQPEKALEAIRNPECGWFYRASASDFKKIPGSPIAYWVSDDMRKIYVGADNLFQHATVVCGMTTGNNAQFTRLWQEVSLANCTSPINSSAEHSTNKWFPYNKGGAFRKWYGNNEFVVNWSNDGSAIVETGKAYPRAKQHYLKDGITWSFISSSYFGVRASPPGFIFDMAGCSAFPHSPSDKLSMTAFLCSRIAFEQLKILNPTLNFQVGNVGSLPWLAEAISSIKWRIDQIASQAIDISARDWNANENSWGFSQPEILRITAQTSSIGSLYTIVREEHMAMVTELWFLEEENNRLFLQEYELLGALTQSVALDEITLNANPHYRYGSAAIEEKQLAKLHRRWPQVVAIWPEADIGIEQRLLADTMREFISYAVGCMFGRYSLDKPGLILANQGETVADYLRVVSRQPSAVSFMPDEDNVLPILDGDWFEDDIAERFKQFLRVTFGDEHFADNLAFIETAIGRDIRSYFLRDFYDHHVKMYKKRPIYWLFSSPKGSFNALIYMHRYRPDTVSVVLNNYLRDFRAKLQAQRKHLQQIQIAASSSNRDKARAQKEITALDKTLHEIEAYERDVLFPLATKQIEIDLDDGVLVNYNRFGKALKTISGVSGKPIPDWAKPGNRVA